MFCPKCGAENSEESKFCLSCGTNLPTEAVPSAPDGTVLSQPDPAPQASVATVQKENAFVNTLKGVWSKCVPFLEKAKNYAKANKLIVGGALGGIALFILVCIIISIATSGNGYISVKSSVADILVDDGNIVIIRDANLIKTDIEAESYTSAQRSIDGSVIALLTNNETLHVLKGNKVINVAEDVYSFKLSVDGNGIAYMVEDDGEYVLNLYNIGSKKNSAISSEVSSTTYDISPDGKSVCYYEANSDDENVLYYATASKKTKISSSNVTLVGLSNGGKYIYAVGKNDDGNKFLYVYNTKGDRQKLGGISTVSVAFNSDHTQVLFYNDGKTYISTKGKDSVKISSSVIRLLIAPNSSVFSDGKHGTYPVKNLYDHAYSGTDSSDNYSVWYIRKNTEKSCKLVSNVRNVQLDASAEYLYYIYDGELRVVEISKGDSASEKYKVLGDDVEGYLVTSDRSKVYYYDDDTLYSANGKTGSGKKTVASDVEAIDISGKDVVFYLTEDGDLYATSNGGKGKKVLSDILYVYAADNECIYAVAEDTVYASTGGKNLKKIYEKD